MNEAEWKEGARKEEEREREDEVLKDKQDDTENTTDKKIMWREREEKNID